MSLSQGMASNTLLRDDITRRTYSHQTMLSIVPGAASMLGQSCRYRGFERGGEQQCIVHMWSEVGLFIGGGEVFEGPSWRSSSSEKLVTRSAPTAYSHTSKDPLAGAEYWHRRRQACHTVAAT